MHAPATEGAGASLPDTTSDAQASDTLTPCPPQFRDAERRLLRKTGRLAELTDMQRNVLAAMLRLAVQWRDPAGWFVLSFKRLMVELQRSYNSIDTHVQALRGAGWIERDRDIAGARRLGFPIGSTRLTPQALEALGLHLPPHTQVPGHACKDFKGLNPIGGQGAAAPALVDNPPNTEQPEHPVPTALPDGQQFHVRRDLMPLLQVLVPAQIKKVLGVAKRAGVWVQHVMAHRLPAILRARDPEGYLVHLIGTGEDWARQAAPTAAPAGAGAGVAPPDPEQARVAALGAAVPGFLTAHAGQWLAKADDSVLLEVHASGCVEHRKAYGQWLRGDAQPAVLPRIVDAAQAGRLRFMDAIEAAAILGGARCRKLTTATG